jgi:NADH-quinone oxidoreductase subunit M
VLVLMVRHRPVMTTAPIPQPPFLPRPAARLPAGTRNRPFRRRPGGHAGLLLVALRAGTTDLQTLASRAGQGLSPELQTLAAALIVFGLAVKVPAFGVHTWLPPAHTIAPTGGSMLLAGVLLKMGSYGLVRVAVPVVPEGVRTIAPLLGALGVAGILWAGLACFVQTDLKRLIALSSVAHMGFILLGIASMTPQGLRRALRHGGAHLYAYVPGVGRSRTVTSADLTVIGRAARSDAAAGLATRLRRCRRPRVTRPGRVLG